MNAGPNVDRSATFYDPIWLQAVGGVRADNALEYFSRSPFFFRAEGIEFVLDTTLQHQSGPAFVIKRQRRKRADVVEAEAYFYILLGSIYQCPSLYEVATSRMNKMSFYLKRAYNELEKNAHKDKDEPYRDSNNPFPELGPNLLEELITPKDLPVDSIAVKFNIHPNIDKPSTTT